MGKIILTQNNIYMKKIFIAFPFVAMIACNDNSNSTAVPVSDTSTTTTSMSATSSSMDTTAADKTYVKRKYTPGEGDVIYRDRKVSVWKNGTYAEADKDVTLDSGIVVKRSGDVTWKDQNAKLQEGDAVSKTGDFFDNAGDKIEDAWHATKRGVKKAADAVGKTAKKTGEKVNDAVH
jgi:hypothetical protein